MSMEGAALLFLLFSSFHIQEIYTAEMSNISESQFLTAGDTVVSPAGIFVLGFFRPGSSKNSYLGIWYKESVRTVVWVANRQLPLTDPSSGVLKIVDPGILVLINGTNDTIWSSNTTAPSRNVIARLLDTGNLVVTGGKRDPLNYLWQSFDYPTDTLLAGMKFGRDLLKGKEWHLSSWSSVDDPAPGEFTLSADTRGYPQNLLRQGTVVKYRGGPWNGERFFSVADSYGPNTIVSYNMVINETEVSYTYDNLGNSVPRFVLNNTGHVQLWLWTEILNNWVLIFNLPKDKCDTYSTCGAYGSCIISDPQECVCLDNTSFVPTNKRGWETADWSGGCVRRTPLDCKSGSYTFNKYSNVKLPDTKNSWANISMTLKECGELCSKNCTCMAYGNTDIREGGSGCLLWFNDLIDIEVFSKGGQDIFVRVASSELDTAVESVSKKKGGAKIKLILPTLFLGILLIGVSSTLFWYRWRKMKSAHNMDKGDSLHVSDQMGSQEDGLPLFNFSTISKATASFSLNNKLGEGGFGPVYKGMLEEGQEIAVKRLSKTSSQGIEEFKNEVICISKLQHRNLVKLLGCCIQGDEMLLIYEYMPNRSLDSFIFDITKSMLLDWTKRFNIIKGIARGLLYLHQDSRLRIIHRDLKASNILLDLDMNPKISDFGIARSFGGNETHANTQRVVGTYGYMSPEYALDGLFSIKSDVFSFGVLVLEILSGKKNREFIHSEHNNNLIGHVWTLHNAGRSMEMIDATLAESCCQSEVLRSIRVGLLCVQESAEDRPNMSSVVLMLESEGVWPQPKQPAFFTENNLPKADISSSTYPTSSVNDLTITEVDGR